MKAGHEAGAPSATGEGPEADGRSRLRTILLYAGMVIVGFVVIQVVLHAGHGLHAPKPAGAAQARKAGGQSTEDLVWRLLLASSVIIVVSRLVGAAFQKIHQPQVVGEIVAGIVLGPSLLGRVAPTLSHHLFSAAVLPYLDVLAQVGLVFFMFLIGLELDLRLIRGRGHTAATVSHVSIIAPFVMGGGLALYLFPTLGSESGRFTPFALFLGASMSITAFPVLARILTERGIYKTHLGAITLTCAAVDDVTAWCMLAVVVAIARANGAGRALITIGLSIGFIVLMVLAVRPLLARVARYHEERGTLAAGMLALLFVGILLSALATDRIGIHAIFGAFLFGAIMPQRSELVSELVQKLEDFTVVFLLPLFFAFTGLRTNVGLLGSDPKLWLAALLVLLVAIFGKWGASSAAAKVSGVGWRESMALGVLMNTRGLTELIILNIGLDLRVIPPTLFAILVLMALVTTFMTTPLLAVFYPPSVMDEMVEQAGDDKAEEGQDGPRPYRMLVPVAKVSSSGDLVHTALRLVRDRDERAEVVLLRTVEAPGGAYRAGPRQYEAMVERATQSLRALVQLVEGAGHVAVPVVIPSRDVAGAISSVAKEQDVDLVLIGFSRSLWGNRLLGGTVGEVLRRAETDVAVVVDPAGQGLASERGARILVPYGGGFHEDVGLDLALRLAASSAGSITLTGPADEEEAALELAQRAARAYEETGVWTVPIPLDDEPGVGLVEQARNADLVVLGVGDEWVRNKDSLGGLREAVAARATAPILIVRRHGQKGGLRKPREWIVDTGETTAIASKDDVIARHLS